MIFLPCTVWILGVNFGQVRSRKFVSQGRSKNIPKFFRTESDIRPKILKINLIDLFLAQIVDFSIKSILKEGGGVTDLGLKALNN